MSYIIRSFGSNGYGQLGLGHTNDVEEPQIVNIDTNYNGIKSKNKYIQNEINISCGGNHTIIILNGNVFGSGDNSEGQLGIENIKDTVTYFTKFIYINVQSLVKYSQINPLFFRSTSSTWDTSILISDSGDIYTFGNPSNNKFTLGRIYNKNNYNLIGLVDLSKDIPQNVSKRKAIFSSSGVSHTLVYCSDNSIWGWGLSRNGQLGSKGNFQTPIRVKILEPDKVSGIKLLQLACGRAYSAALYSDGKINLIGADKHGLKTQIPMINDIQHISSYTLRSGWSCLHLLDSNGKITSWGNNVLAQNVPITAKNANFKFLASGSEHSLVVDYLGNVFAWGWGEHGNCGHVNSNKIDHNSTGDIATLPNIISYLNPIPIPNDESIFNIKCGCATSWIISEMKNLKKIK